MLYFFRNISDAWLMTVWKCTLSESVQANKYVFGNYYLNTIDHLPYSHVWGYVTHDQLLYVPLPTARWAASAVLFSVRDQMYRLCANRTPSMDERSSSTAV